MTRRVITIAPNCPAEIDAMIRRDAAKRGDTVMPAQPYPWNRKAADQKVVAERKWLRPSTARKPQKPCDVGLFSDDRDQLDLVDISRRKP